MRALLGDIAYYLPQKKISNAALCAKNPDWQMDKIVKKTGISSRHIVAVDETVVDMACHAANRLFASTEVSRDQIDYIVFCTQSPGKPLTISASILQHQLGMPNRCGALDINMGCSGYVYGLSVIKGLIVSKQAKRILLITSEAYSYYLNPNDRATTTLFGDGAAASLIISESVVEPNKNYFELGEFCFFSDGSGAKDLFVPKDFLFMDGPKVFNFVMATVPKAVNKVLAENNLSINDIDLFVFHQASRYLLDSLKAVLNISDEKFYVYLEDVANTVSSTIPIALCEALKVKDLRKSSHILLIGFGVGYSLSATVVTKI